MTVGIIFKDFLQTDLRDFFGIKSQILYEKSLIIIFYKVNQIEFYLLRLQYLLFLIYDRYKSMKKLCYEKKNII